MPSEKKKDLGVIIAMGGPKKMPMDEEPEGEAEESGAEPGAFEQAASEAFAAAKADDEEGFASALRLAIEALI